MGYFYRQNELLEKLITDYFAAIDSYSKQNCNGELGIILLGSLSRGEATWIQTETGARMVSDIEYFTVYPDGFTDFEGYTKFCEDSAKEIFKGQDSDLFKIDNTFVAASGVCALERKLLTYDAKKMGKCVAGKDYLPYLPEINLSNINLRDIKDVLTHRAFSVLYYGYPLRDEGNEVEYRYNLAKNSLDLMVVLLVSRGRLESGFIRRLDAIKELDIEKEIKDYFEFCLSIKLSSKCDIDFTTEQMENTFIKLVKMLKKEFRIPLKNLFVNFKAVSRRSLGMVKRSVRYRKLPSPSHLSGLISSIEAKTHLTTKQKKNNLVLNGYPTEQEN